MSDSKSRVVRRRKKKEPPAPAVETKDLTAPPVGEKAPPAPPVGKKDMSAYIDHEAMTDTNLSDKPRGSAAGKRKGVVPPRRDYKLIDGIDPFALFAAYHLGLTAADGYRPQNIHDLGRRFRTTPERINAALKAYEIDSETVLNTDFDLSMAEYDIRVAPTGISRTELARQLYEDFRDSPRVARDWGAELAADAAYNDRIFRKLK
ncbi:MAG: hypothetical protein P9L99_08635 [Candidatus Lernaella stagnicola]|nr:hypothetical protein [Candidatus Lernaella stagnicola]